MPIISNQMNKFYDIHFIFRENSIILKDGSLPDESTMRRCLELSVASDWFSEPEKNYTAILLEKDSPNPSGCEDIPLRKFFFQNDEKGDENLSALSARARGLMNFKMMNRYCSVCGGALRDDAAFTAKTCVQCGRQYFPKIEPAIIVLVSRGDEYLLAKHAKRTTSVWTCIAGFVETGETVESCVRREVLEETGIKVKDVRYVASQSWPFPDQLMLAFRAEYDGGEIKVQEEEIVEAKWFNKNNLPEIPGPGSVAYRPITGFFG